MKKTKLVSLSSQNLNYKLKIAFSLMSILPLLVCMYLISNYILPQFGLKMDLTIFMVVNVVIALIGFFVVKEIIDSIISVAAIAKLIASGDINRTIDIERTDEVGDLGDSLNTLTQRIRNYMDELKNYSLKTTEINFEIQKRILVLSSLLQLSSLIAQGVNIDDIIKLAIEKSRLLADSEVSYLLFREEGHEIFDMKMADGINASNLLSVKVDPNKSIFGKLIKNNKPFILDKQNVAADNIKMEFQDKFKLNNTLAIPVYLRGRVVAILGVGNSREDFVYEKEDTELLDIFAKQIAIGIENDVLLHQVEKLEVKDILTGLYNKNFIVSRLQEEIRRAIICQRPCSFVILNIDDFGKYKTNFGSLQAEAVLGKIASMIKESVTEIDRVARFGDNEFALVLPEKNKRQSRDVSEVIRKKMETTFGKEQDLKQRLTLSGGVSENPLDGVTGDELIKKAEELLGIAKKQGKNNIVSTL